MKNKAPLIPVTSKAAQPKEIVQPPNTVSLESLVQQASAALRQINKDQVGLGNIIDILVNTVNAQGKEIEQLKARLEKKD